MTELDKKLYEIFADKTLSEGCMIHYYSDTEEKWEIVKFLSIDESRAQMRRINAMEDSRFVQTWIRKKPSKKQIILGHEPQLHDVFRLAGSKYIVEVYDRYGDPSYISFKWGNINKKEIDYDTTLPLLKQSDKTKEAIINLFI